MKVKGKKENIDNKDAKVASKEKGQDKSKTEKKQEEKERNGIIPEDMDFKKFLGCGG